MPETPPDPDEPIVPPGEGTMVRFDQVTKAFGDNVVLDALDLSVAAGEKVVIIGPSGSGKTTILRVLMTLERPESGVVWVGGDPLFHRLGDDGRLAKANQRYLREIRCRVGMVFQHFDLFPHMKVLRNVSLAPRKVLGLSKADAEERAVDLLEQVGLADKLDEYPSRLSGGQKQRVAIARALAMEPKVMCFDEVTSALDPELVGEVLNVIRDLAQRSEMSLLLVTHEMGFAREIADRVLMFDQGSIVEEAPPAEMFSNPREPRTKEFLHAVLDRA